MLRMRWVVVLVTVCVAGLGIGNAAELVEPTDIQGHRTAPGTTEGPAAKAAWSSTFGGAANDAFESVRQTTDGGFIVAGYEDSWGSGDKDGWVMKLDSSGNKSWTKTFGGTDFDMFDSVQQTADGGYIVAGRERSWGTGNNDAWIIKLDGSGSKSWAKTFGGISNDWFRSVQQTGDGGYIVAGHESSWGNGYADGWVMKLDSSGNKSWAKTFGGTGNDYFLSVQQTADGGYVVAGYENSWGSGGDDAWVMKLDSSGNKSWAKTFGGTGNDCFICVRQATDGGYIIAGYESSWGNGSDDGWVVKLDASGNKAWAKTFGGTASDRLESAQETADGGFIVAGHVSSWGNGIADGWLMKLGSSGSKTWSKTFGGTANDRFHAVQQTTDTGYAVAGEEYSWGQGSCDGWVMKLSSSGSR